MIKKPPFCFIHKYILKGGIYERPRSNTEHARRTRFFNRSANGCGHGTVDRAAVSLLRNASLLRAGIAGMGLALWAGRTPGHAAGAAGAVVCLVWLAVQNPYILLAQR